MLVENQSARWGEAFAIERYRVTLVSREGLNLPDYLGSTLRGAFGHAFRRATCPGRSDRPCPVPESCPYHTIFESAPRKDSDALRNYEAIPRPFVIAPEPSLLWSDASRDRRSRDAIPPGFRLCFNLTLIGRACRYLPYFVVALREMTRVGRGRKAVDLASIHAVSPLDGLESVVYDASDEMVLPARFPLRFVDCLSDAPQGTVRIDFETQTRLKYEERLVRLPEFHIFFGRLLSRLSALCRFHCGMLMDVDFRALLQEATQVKIASEKTRWVSWARYSSRQNRRIEWSGLVGEVTYEGRFDSFWPYLVFGQWTHVGKGATFGLGGYRVMAGPDCAHDGQRTEEEIEC